ncbi:MAG: Major facilitator superfamily MFS_1 [Petrotoga mobilis]|nr:MAG: Major facilitator superfamily MFS_1 [Petrotoga mobilis]
MNQNKSNPEKSMKKFTQVALLNFIANLCIVLVGPIIMGNYNSVIYGMVNALSGVALVLGGLVASAIPISKNRVKAIFISLILSGIGLCVMGVSPLWYIIGVGFFIFMLPVPFTNATLGTIMQLKIEGNVLGRVGAVIDGLLKIITPVAIVLSGVLAEKVFNPLLIDGGALANTWIGSLIGVGKNRGIGLMFILSGLILCVVCGLMLFNKVVMNLEEKNQDAVLD